jgi:hypothetical protein
METRLKTFNQYVAENSQISENLAYHIQNSLSITESAFRPGSKSHVELLAEARTLCLSGKLKLEKLDEELFKETELGLFGIYRGVKVPLDLVLENLELNEKKGDLPKGAKIGKPMRGGSKKYYVYVRNPKTGKVNKIEFGDPGLTAKVANPKARKSFAARHKCHEKKDRTKAGYWACRINRYAHLWGGKTYPGFW